MSQSFLEDLEGDLFSANRKRPERQVPQAASVSMGKNLSGNPEKKAHFGQEKRGRWQQKTGRGAPRTQKTAFVPSYILESRKSMSEGGIVVVLYIADAQTRSVLFSPRIESRGFFLPNEVREGHKFLLHLARVRYEETLRDVPDIETKDLEKIIKHDMEKAISEKYARSTIVIPLISFV